MQALNTCYFNTCYVSSAPYGYQPSLIANLAFLIIAGGALAGCILYSLSSRRLLAFSVPIGLACLLEILGYIVRLFGWFNPWDVRLYALGMGFLTMGPGFVSVGIHVTIEQCVHILGVEHSPIHPRHYPRFIVAELIGLLIQLVGLVLAFSDLSVTDGLGPSADEGTRIVAVGLAIQILTLSAFLALFGVVLVRTWLAFQQFGYTTFHKERGYLQLDGKFRVFVAVLVVAGVCLLARGFYMTAIMSYGLSSNVAKNQSLFAGFDGLLVAEALVGLVVVNPSSFLDEALWKFEKRKDSTASLEKGMRPMVYY